MILGGGEVGRIGILSSDVERNKKEKKKESSYHGFNAMIAVENWSLKLVVKFPVTAAPLVCTKYSAPCQEPLAPTKVEAGVAPAVQVKEPPLASKEAPKRRSAPVVVTDGLEGAPVAA